MKQIQIKSANMAHNTQWYVLAANNLYIANTNNMQPNKAIIAITYHPLLTL